MTTTVVVDRTELTMLTSIAFGLIVGGTVSTLEGMVALSGLVLFIGITSMLTGSALIAWGE